MKALVVLGALLFVAAKPMEELDLATCPRPVVFVEHNDGYRNVLVAALWADGTMLRLKNPKRVGSKYLIGKVTPDAADSLWREVAAHMEAAWAASSANPDEIGGYTRTFWVRRGDEPELCTHQTRYRHQQQKCLSLITFAVGAAVTDARAVRLKRSEPPGLWYVP